MANTLPAKILSARRYYLAKRFQARDLNEEEGVWKFKQENEPGVILPATFPFLSVLKSFGYKTEEDLEGATADELVEQTDLTTSQAKGVISAYEDL